MSPLNIDRAADANGPSTPSRAQGRRRVILVGRTGLDTALANDPDTDVVETVDALGAIGALSRTDGAAATVVVGPDADPGADAGRFVAGLRQLDPSVRVVVVGDQTRGVYDDAVAAGSSDFPLAARAMLLRSPVVVEVPPGTPLAGIAPGPGGPGAQGVAAQATGDSAAGDTGVVEALLHGRDLLLPALELVRTRLGSRDVYFVPADGAAAHPGAGAPTSWTANVPVAYAGAEYGRLVSGTVGPARLEEPARWLGTWLALRGQQDALREAAFVDELTGAYNRRYFSRFLASAIEQARTRRVPLTVLVFDIDNFKTYNDRFGHAAGDEILSEAARLMRSVIRPADKVCRIGGDEFAVIFYDPAGPRAGRPAPEPGMETGPEAPTPVQPASLGSIYDIATRFQRQICEHRFPKLGAEAPGTLTISGGMATFPDDGTTPQELLERADQLALQSKRAGKNVITFGPGAERVCRM